MTRLSPKELLKHNKSQFIQILGQEGSGTRRSCLELIRPSSRVVWLSSQWIIYAPLLWSLAQRKQISLLGVECPDRQRWRVLWRELFEANSFDVWVLDHLHLKNSEGFYLRQLIQKLGLQIYVLEDRVHAFCEKRLRVQLQHHEHQLCWQKGGPPQSFKIPADYLKNIREELCSL